MDIAVIIVTWNVEDIVQGALRTLYADLDASGLDAQVIVVDSASADDTVATVRQNFPQVQVIASDENLGFGRANNVGMRHLGFGDSNTSLAALPRAVYLLNPDTLTQPGATRTLYEALLADDQRGVVGARLTYGDGTHQHSGFHFPGLRQLWVEFFPTPGRFIDSAFNGRYPRANYAPDAPPFHVDFMLGATMMLRREVIQQTGMFDEAFFMYGEEVDWQWRIRNAGWQILCVPQAHVVHLEGKSTGQAKARSVLNLWESRLRLYAKHYPAWKLWLARRMVAWGMMLKQRRVSASTSPDLIAAYQTVREMALSSS